MDIRQYSRNQHPKRYRTISIKSLPTTTPNHPSGNNKDGPHGRSHNRRYRSHYPRPRFHTRNNRPIRRSHRHPHRMLLLLHPSLSPPPKSNPRSRLRHFKRQFWPSCNGSITYRTTTTLHLRQLYRPCINGTSATNHGFQMAWEIRRCKECGSYDNWIES